MYKNKKNGILGIVITIIILILLVLLSLFSSSTENESFIFPFEPLVLTDTFAFSVNPSPL